MVFFFSKSVRFRSEYAIKIHCKFLVLNFQIFLFAAAKGREWVLAEMKRPELCAMLTGIPRRRISCELIKIESPSTAEVIPSLMTAILSDVYVLHV